MKKVSGERAIEITNDVNRKMDLGEPMVTEVGIDRRQAPIPGIVKPNHRRD